MEPKHASFRTPLKQVRGLGAAHEGTGHFWLQRTTALALIPLSVWFMIKLVGLLGGAERGIVAIWFANPLSALFMAVFIVALFIHARLGIQTIIEDYAHCEAKKLALLVLNSGVNLLLCLASLAAIAHLHFIGI